VITALKAMTIWSAYQHFEEKTKGSIEVGKLADFAILSKDPTAVDPETIDQIKVTETVKEGKTIFALSEQERRKAALMLEPRGNGAVTWQRFLQAGAAHQERTAFPAFALRTNMDLLPQAHDPACLARYFDGLMQTILAQGTGEER